MPGPFLRTYMRPAEKILNCNPLWGDRTTQAFVQAALAHLPQASQTTLGDQRWAGCRRINRSECLRDRMWSSTGLLARVPCDLARALLVARRTSSYA